MKKLLSAIICAAIIFSTTAVPAFAADYTLEVENGEIDDYGNIKATINISENSGIYYGSFKFLYNSSCFELGDIKVNQSDTNGKIEVSEDTDNGVITFTYSANDDGGCTYGGEFATLDMRLIATSESVISFNLDMAKMEDFNGNSLEATYKISPIQVPQSFIVTEAATEETQEATQKPITAETVKEVEKELNGGFFHTLWSIVKVLFIILAAAFVLIIIISFFTRRYFKKKRRMQRALEQRKMSEQNPPNNNTL